MTKKEEKKYEYMEDGTLIVMIQSQDPLYLPGHNGNVEIGVQDQTTIHTIPKKSVGSLKAYIKTQREMMEAEQKNLKIELERMNFINADAMDEKMLKELQSRLDKNKPFKKAVKDLNQYVGQMVRKKQVLFKLDQLDQNLKVIAKDEAGVNDGS